MTAFNEKKRMFPNTVWTSLLIVFASAMASASASATDITGTVGASSGAGHALVFDLTKIVYLRGQAGWTIDRYELEKLLPDALMSVCLVQDVEAKRALKALKATIVAKGGPVESAWQRHDKDLGKVSNLLLLTRVHDLLELAQKRRQDCNFYLTADDKFAGRQIDTDHLTLNVEGGGLFTVRRAQGKWIAGGGGIGRLTAGYGLSPRWWLRTGAEIGGAALVSQDISTESLDVDVIVGVPITFRRLTPSWYYDLEVAAIGLGIPWREDLRYGFRVGTAIGMTYLRVRSLLPWGGYAVNFEYVLPRGPEPGQWSVRMGLRVGFNLRAVRL